MVSKSVSIFDQFVKKYDEWFDAHPHIFQAEINALKKLMPQKGIGIEIGVGSGRFACALNIHYGIEPVKNGYGEGGFVVISAEPISNLN